MGYEWLISLRYLGSKRRRMVSLITFISIAGVALGVMLLIVVLSVMGGFANDLKQKIVGTKAHVVISAERGHLTDPERIMELLPQQGEITGYAPYVESEVMISTATNVEGIVLRGIDLQMIAQVSELPDQIQEGGELLWLETPERASHQRFRNDPQDVRDLDMTLERFRTASAEYERLALIQRDRLAELQGEDEEKNDLLLTPAQDTQAAVEDTQAAVEDTQAAVEDTQAAVEDTQAAVEDTQAAVEDTQAAVEDTQAAETPRDSSAEPERGRVVMPTIPGQPRLPADDSPSLEGSAELEGVRPFDMRPIGDPTSRRQIPGIIIGTELANKLFVSVGDEVTIINPDGQILPTGLAPSSRPYVVVATFNSGLYEFDTRFAYILLSEAQNLLRMRANEVTAIDVRLRRIDDAGRVEVQLSGLMEANGLENVLVRSWEKLNRSLFMALKLEKIAIFIILTIIILVASFSIVSNLVVMVVERASEIAILKCMGATNRAITRIFAINGGIIGGIGTSLGVIVGVSICLFIKHIGLPLDTEVYYIEYLPVDMAPLEILSTAVAGVAISLLATVYPARKAAQLKAADALRYE